MKASLVATALGIALLAGAFAVAMPVSAHAAPIGDGSYRVGRDIAPGTYRTRAPAHGCYWARLSGFSGTFHDVKANDFGSGFMVVTIHRHDVGFQSSGCGVWSGNLSRVTSSRTTFGHGTFMVGTDIRPGWYRSSSTGGCYWARLSGFDGSLRHVIKNGLRLRGHALVHIRRADAGFQSRGCGTWSRL